MAIKLFMLRRNGSRGREILTIDGFKLENELKISDFDKIEYLTNTQVFMTRGKYADIRGVQAPWKIEFGTKNLFDSHLPFNLLKK